MAKPKIGISVGDINGIGLEVILKTLVDKRITNLCTPIIYCNTKVVSYHKNIVGLNDFSYQNIRSAEHVIENEVNILSCWQDNVNITLGKTSDDSGKYGIISLDKVTDDLRYGVIDAMVTAPINKEAMEKAGFEYPGHTEYLTAKFDVEESLMLLVSDELKIGVVTNHIPVNRVAKKMNSALIVDKINILNDTLKKDYGLDAPKIAVLALNPHAGDGGLIGEEEKKYILPAINEVKEKGIFAFGPYPADGFFGSSQYRKFDAVLAMYHDQGLIPFKLLSFGAGVNHTAGLPFVRTSPDHGTAYEIAGQNIADESSFRKALFAAIDIVRNRETFKENHANPLARQQGKIIENPEEEKAFVPDEEELER